LTFAETLNGQFGPGETITCMLQNSATNENNQVFVSTANSNDLPIVSTNTASGLIAHLSSATNGLASFSIMVDQSAFAPSLGTITVSNLHYVVVSGAILGPVTVECSNFSHTTFNENVVAVGAQFDAFVSNAAIGTAPVVTAPAVTTSGTALGATKVGPFTVATKVAKLGQYVTWKFSGGSALVGKTVQIWVATKNSAGKWSAFALTTARRVDASGNAYFWWKTSSKAWISVRAGYLTTLSVATQARWL
jgi:hypothetical protein